LPRTRGTLRFISDARAYMTAMGKQRELRQHWQRDAKLDVSRATAK